MKNERKKPPGINSWTVLFCWKSGINAPKNPEKCENGTEILLKSPSHCAGRSDGIFGTVEYIPTLRLANELADLRVGYANPIRTSAVCVQASSSRGGLTRARLCEVASSPHRLRQNEKKTVKNGLFGRSGGTRTHGLQYPKLARYHLRYASWSITLILYHKLLCLSIVFLKIKKFIFGRMWENHGEK